MRLTSQSNTQVYSPFGPYVVEQHDSRQPAFEVPELPSGNCGPLSADQAAVGLRLQRYFPLHAMDATPTRLQILLNILMHRCEAQPH